MDRVDRTEVGPVESAAGVYLALDDVRLLAQCEVDLYRASGPGGQKRNKTSSAVRLRHRPTALSVIATEDRSQHVNKRRALKRMRMAIAFAVRGEVDLSDYVRSGLLGTCIEKGGRLRLGRRDDRYYPVVSELLDLLAACRGGVRDAAKLLDISTANLIAFFHDNPKLWGRVNEIRSGFGVKPLR